MLFQPMFSRNMEMKGLKDTSCIEWQPQSLCTPVCDPDDGSNLIPKDLMQHMTDKLKYQGMGHQISYFTMKMPLHDDN